MSQIDLSKQTRLPAAYEHKLILCRTDQHVVWRGDNLIDSWEDLMPLLKGHAQKSSQYSSELVIVTAMKVVDKTSQSSLDN